LNKRTKYQMGFTLIEVLVAMLIFSIVMITLFSSFKAFIITSENITREVSQNEKMRNVLKRICLDFEQLYVLKVPRYKKPEFNSEPDPYRFVGNEVGVGQKIFSSVTFASLAHVKIGKDLHRGVAKISYYVKENENNSFDLFRADSLPPYPVDIESCADHLLGEDILEFGIFYTDINGDEHRYWDSESDEFQYIVPASVNLRILFNSQGKKQMFETSVKLISARAPIE